MLSEIKYPCKIDGSMQSAYMLKASAAGPRPLVVALHTWSYTYEGTNAEYERLARLYDWNLIYPDFRGPNWTPQACGSEFVVSDLEDAVAFMKSECDIDASRIYLTGGSGGGHCTLLMAGRRPDLWTAVSAWCPISDIAAWHRQCLGTRCNDYAIHIEKSCGGNPQEDAVAAVEARKRSPLTWLPNAAALPVDINTGIHDGHTGSVPVSQSLNAYNVLARPEDRIPQEAIDGIVATEAVPAALAYDGEDASYGVKIHLRRQSANVRMTLFEGGHDCFVGAAFDWLSRQQRGAAPDWNSGSPESASNGNLELSK
ncbi:MAG: prolyl oligopeptidase family serine peptidase [Victivallales bacterium]|nr:prolyl oligopeptidase family serine peptidase [Victivallales bacterium]